MLSFETYFVRINLKKKLMGNFVSSENENPCSNMSCVNDL
jgi:hypothetical protein